MILGHTKLYTTLSTPSCTVIERERERAGINFEVTNQKIRFLSIPLLSGCQKLPDRKMYWETSPNTFV